MLKNKRNLKSSIGLKSKMLIIKTFCNKFAHDCPKQDDESSFVNFKISNLHQLLNCLPVAIFDKDVE